MAYSNVSHQQVSLKYGIFVGIAHILYFLLMRVFGVLHIVELSFLSAIFLIVGIVLAISAYKRAVHGRINYLNGLAIGAIVGVVSSVLLAVFLAVYLGFFDAEYVRNLQASALFPEGLSLLTVFILTIVYGTWPGFLIAFVAMQWFKRDDHSATSR